DGAYKTVLEKWKVGMHAVEKPLMNAATQ
ncbi:MAG: hypothetical protein JWR89_4667, partial [Tardiphaga sp.]|nr:hypothetical protein [Tardiphaga sp.]